VLLNISSILASLFLQQHLAQPIYAMAIAVFVGGVLQVAIQIPALVRIGMLPRCRGTRRPACPIPACAAC
jgi:putative peptidoglycan lipid II flippase